MTGLDLTALSKPVVQPITIPVPASTLAELKATMRTDPSVPSPSWAMRMEGLPCRGRWMVVGVRSDYSLPGGITYWATLEWVDDHG